MKLLCPACGITFEAEGQRRCPQCLRRHGLEPVLETARRAAPRGRPRWPLVLVAVSLIAFAAGGLLLLRLWRGDLPAPGQLAELGPALLRRTLIARGVPPELAKSPFASSPALHTLARAAGGDPAGRARQLARRLAALLARAAPDLDGSAEVPVRPGAAELLEALQAKRALAVRSLEAAVLMVALCREARVSAVLASATRLEAPVRSPSIAAGVGRYLVVIYSPGKLGRDPLLVLDPLRAMGLPAWAGGGGDPEMKASVDGFTPLDDASAAAHLLGLRALALREQDPQAAYRLSERALAAAAPSPELHLVRAVVLAAAGGSEDALAEVHRSLAVRSEPAGRVALATLLAEAGRFRQALEPLQKAVSEEPDYWPARLMLAGLEGALDPRRAEPHLAAARRIAPEEPAVLVAEAAIELGQGRGVPARDLLRRATARRPSTGGLLLLYRALLQTGARAEAAGVRKQILKRTRPVDRSSLEQHLQAIEQLSTEAPASAPAEPPRAPKVRSLRLPDVRLGR